MKKIKMLVPVLGLMLTVILVFTGQKITKAESNSKVTIEDGVSIGNVDVSGMTAEQAEDAVNNFLSQLEEETFTLTSENGSMEATVADMGLTYDVEGAVQDAVAVGHSGSLIRRFKEVTDLASSPQTVDLKLKVDNQTTARLLYANGDELNLEAVNMGLEKSGSSFTTTPGQDGNEVDYVESVGVINDFINAWTPGQENEITLVCEDVEYLGSEEELAKVKDCLGSFSTYFGTGTTGRETNVANGCACINGSVVYPGEEFSANEAMSPYTYENGYADGGSYENGQVVSSIGGGICQVSSTLYNAVIRAELEITLRAAHSMVVSYVDLSDDAAIAGDYKDLRFINNTDAPIYIEGYCSGGYIYFNIYGEETRDSGRSVSFESETLETTTPDTNFVLSADQPLGYYNVDVKPHIGYKARLWKIVTENGVEKSRDVFNNSTYSAASGTTTIGVAGATEEQLAQINAAIEQAHEADDDTIVESLIASLAGTAVSDPAAVSTDTTTATTNAENSAVTTPTAPAADAGTTQNSGSTTGTGSGTSSTTQ